MDGGVAEGVVGSKKQGVVGRKEGETGLKGRRASRLGQEEQESVRELRYGWRNGALRRLRC